MLDENVRIYQHKLFQGQGHRQKNFRGGVG